MKTLLLALALVPFACDAATIYSCKRAKGEVFWAATPCNQHHAIRTGIFSVPDGLPFEQQVQHAKLHATRAECKRLEARIARLDAAASPAQAARERDRGKRRQARDRQAALNCR